ncbi:MAG: hypothetical protein QM731_07225 [Chitinophagaceae bacterium]
MTDNSAFPTPVPSGFDVSKIRTSAGPLPKPATVKQEANIPGAIKASLKRIANATSYLLPLRA